ncbi:hypothetical protein BYT27DRAFT_7185097 [Phlegmacium glaucopus]|nr:hypothetical protein BYT27DRAFT_7185097 [Phlegmacium glaucopus]
MAHHKLDSNHSGSTAVSSDTASERIMLKDSVDGSPTDSQFPDIPNATSPTTYNKPPPIRREGTLDPRLRSSFIPPKHSNRTLVLCFDGTGDQFDADNSNIVQLVSLLKKDDNTKQMVYYQAGIGTYCTSNNTTSSFMSSIRRTLDEMVAWSIADHVMGGYKFLMQHYVAGDKICLFGFSRGAYTARSLAGMLSKVGLLPAGNIQQVQFAYKMYMRDDGFGWEQSVEFKKAFSVNVPIEFIGVWDTVSALGFLPKSLPVTTASTSTRTFRHALSLDERRARFQPHLWHLPIGKKSELEHLTGADIETDVEEVWFAGCHCDVGGGAVSNKTRCSLARISLRWMIRECFKTGTGIMFNSALLYDIGLDPSTLDPFITPRPQALPVGSHLIRKPPTTPIPIGVHALLKEKGKRPDIMAESEIPYFGTEEQEELHDALSPNYDQLKMKKAWWILEILPFQGWRRKRGRDSTWVKYSGPHFGAPRVIPHQNLNGLKVHRSVKLRREAEFEDERARGMGKRYEPKPEFEVETTWVA